MPFIFSPEATDALDAADRCIEDRRNNPIRGRKTKFRIMSANSLAYTFPDYVPGFSPNKVRNDMPFNEFVHQPLNNADEEGKHLFPKDYSVSSNAKAKVVGDSFEIMSCAILWNIAARWNTYMVEGAWPQRTPYQRPTAERSQARQIAVLNLPRQYDWVKLLTPDATNKIKKLRKELADAGLRLVTSTPDAAIVVLPESHWADERWRTELPDLQKPHQAELQHAYRHLQGQIEPGEILLAVAFKRSLRSDRLYQPLYEANIMQLLLEGQLNAPRVEFEVHTLEQKGTRARTTYEAASLYSVLEPARDKHRAVRDLYVPENAQELARRLLKFLNERTSWIE